MVIQRWQSVYLLLAIFAIILVCIRPFGLITDHTGVTASLVASDYPILLTVNILTGVLLLIDIFLYKNLKYQRLVAAVCSLLIIASAVTAFIITTRGNDACKIAWTGAPVGYICALICALFARHRMGQDEKLLKSYDRIR